MSSQFYIENQQSALRWCDLFRLLGFKPGLDYWTRMNLRLSDGRAQCVNRNGVLAAQECEKPIPPGEKSPRDEYLPSRQRILDGFMANIEAECGKPVMNEVLAWAEYDYGVDPEDGRDEFEWFNALTDMRNDPERIGSRLGIDRQLMERITHLIENDIVSPFVSLKEEFNNLCLKIESDEFDAEYCRNRFTSIHLITNSMNVRRCWTEIQTLLEGEVQDAILAWYQETRKDTLSRFPQFNREVLPMRQ